MHLNIALYAFMHVPYLAMFKMHFQVLLAIFRYFLTKVSKVLKTKTKCPYSEIGW